MGRTYTKNKRAENEAETRQRIAEAALSLHAEHGPSATTVSMIAERAGVQRHTVYAHFPDPLTLQMACSGLFADRNPIPDPAQWAAVNDPSVRMKAALNALYDWFGRGSGLTALVLRDAERDEVTRKVVEARTAPGMAAIAQSLSGGLDESGHAALRLAMSFFTWRTLVEDAGLDNANAAELMARAVLGAD